MMLAKMKSAAWFFLACWVVAVVPPATAAPIKRADVSVGALWVAHIDCDALRQTYIGKYLLYRLDKPEMNSNMVAFRSIFSFDLRTQLHGLTIYNNGPTPQDKITIVYADFDPKHVIALVQAGEAARAYTNHERVIYSWIEKKKTPADNDRPRNYGSIHNGFMILGTDQARVNAAVDVIDKLAPNLSESASLPELTGDGATFIQAGARQLDSLGPEPNMALLKSSQRAKFQAKEVDDQLNASLTLEMGDEAKARQTLTAVQGLISLLRLQKDNPKAARLADVLNVKLAGNNLIATLTVPSADLIAAIKTYAAQKEKVKAETK
jgi:hypothetical protein